MKLNSIDLNKLNTFCSVIEHHGFKKASEDLNLTRSAISQSISGLENSLGFALFHRVGRRLIPTEKGEALYAQFHGYQLQLQKTLTGLGKPQHKVEGLVRLGAYFEFAKNRLMPCISEFLQTYPDVEIQFTFDSPTRLESLLLENRIDMAFSIYPQKNAGTQSIQLLEQELVLIAPKGWIGNSFSAQELLALPIIDYFRSHLVLQRWLKFHFNYLPRKIPVKIFAASSEMVLKLVEQGLGIGMVPLYLLDSLPTNSTIEIYRPGKNKLLDYIWLNELKQNFNNTAHHAFSKMVSNHFSFENPPTKKQDVFSK